MNRSFFHYISYLQYPFMIIALYFIVQLYLKGISTLDNETKISSLNYTLIFMGLGVSFSSLQDPKKTQNEFSKKIWQSPKKGSIMIILMCLLAVFFILLGLWGLFATDHRLHELSMGLVVFGIGLIGMIKVALEMFENHRLDKNGDRILPRKN